MKEQNKTVTRRQLGWTIYKKSVLLFSIFLLVTVISISIEATSLPSYGDNGKVPQSLSVDSIPTYNIREENPQQELKALSSTNEESTEAEKPKVIYNTQSYYEQLVEHYKKEAKENEEKRKSEVTTTVSSKFSETVAETTTEACNNNYSGCYTLTAYCPCSICCGQWAGGPTASGVMPSAGRTVACNNLPLGTKIYIEGYGTYTVEDTGGMGSGVIDVFFATHSEAQAFGTGSANVYIVQ